ncbi:MAG: hypothetical protein K0R51_828 [Cytophagaceae bacterium]|jgi:CubicO group peptidase (beta-lactamase class C family)|nr:hypothetical protein [Cytophagaceae bacterium]
MQNYFLVVASFLLSTLLSFSSFAQGNPINQLLESKKENFNGHVIMVVKQKDSVLYHHQIGLAKLDTKIPVASASKWLSAAVILTLVDQGLLSLDDSIGKYLPAFSTYGKGHPTIRQCLTHTSGFPAYSTLNYKDIGLAPLVDSMAKYVPLKNTPGASFNYGGMSYRIVGRIAEVVTGKSWNELFHTNIASKCEMNATAYCHEKITPDLGGGVCSTPADYLNFLNMISGKGIYKGSQVLSSASVNEFFRSQLSTKIREDLTKYDPEIKVFANGKLISYGLGTWILDYNESQEYQSKIFCPGGFGTFPFIDTCRNIYGIILTHTQISKVIETEFKAISIVKEKHDGSCK